ncbi:MAG: hypothetical protein ACOH12_03150 [Parvibaculaceae bacterium]
MTIEYVEAWKKNDPKLESDARRIWSDPGVLPPGIGAEDRIEQLAVVAYENGELAGLSTLNVLTFSPLKQKFAFFRGYVLPDFRLREVGRDIVLETYNRIEAYALANPQEKIAGMMAVVQIPNVGENPQGKKIKMTLIGYTNDNQQVRLTWFDHFRVPLNMTDF